jgi:hypothetical protein
MTLSISDNFNRADVDPIGGSWAPLDGSNTVKIVSNKAMASAAYSFMYWNAATANDQYAECKSTVSGDYNSGPAIRMQTGGIDSYFYLISTGELYKYVSSSPTILGNSGDTGNTTSIYKLEAIGTALKVYKDSVQIISVTDSSHSSGYCGLFLGNGTAAIDDFAGGDAGPAATVLTGSNCSQSNTTTNGAIGQENIVTAGNSTQANTSSSGAIVQVILGEMLADNSTQSNESTSGGVIQAQAATAGNSTQVNGSTNGVIAMTHILSADDNTQANLSATGLIAQVQVLLAANSIQINLSDSGRMLLTPGYWYNESAEISPWVINLDGSTTWSPSPPTTSIWS